MPAFYYQDKDGTPYLVEANDEKAADRKFEQMRARGGEPASTAEDVVKSAGAGLAKGVLSIPEAPANMESLVRAGINTAKDKLFVGSWREPISSKPEIFGSVLPHGGSAQKWAEQYTGPFHEPETTAGGFAEKVGEFAPGAAIPGTVVQRGMNWLAPAVGAELGGKVAQQMGYDENVGEVAGALVGPSAARAVPRAVSPFPARNPEITRLDNVLEQEGVRRTAGDSTGNRKLKFAESAYGEYPFAGGRFAEIKEGQAEDFTRAVLRRVGEDADRATAPVIDRAFQRLGHQFDTVLGRNQMLVDRQLFDDLTNIQRNYDALVSPNNRAGVVADTVNDVITNWSPRARGTFGPVDGAVYSDMRQRLFQAARGTDDVALSRTLWGLRNALDDAFERSMTRAGRLDDVAAWRQAREQWADLLVVERAAKAPGAEAGILSPAQIRAGIVNQNERDYVRGDGRFNDLARAGAELLKPMPNSGTPARLAVTDVPGALAGSAGYAVGGAPGAALGMAARTLAPAVAGRVVMHPVTQAYFRNQAAAPIWRGMVSPYATWAGAAGATDEAPEAFIDPTTGQLTLRKPKQ